MGKGKSSIKMIEQEGKKRWQGREGCLRGEAREKNISEEVQYSWVT